jgi:SNF2 family DNA or RNA helicase
MPELPDGWIAPTEFPPASYQTLGAILASEQNYALFCDMGTGKTYIAANVMSNAARRQGGTRRTDKGDVPTIYRVLIVCPKQVQENWYRELQRFMVVPGKIAVCRGGENRRLKGLTQVVIAEEGRRYGAAIISPEALTSSVDIFSAIPWDLVVVDESHNFKSPSTARWKTLQRIRSTSRQRLILSGSPIGNTPFDLWTQLEFLDAGMSGFSTYAAFKEFYGKHRAVIGVPGVQRLEALQNMPLLRERLARCALKLTKSEAGLDLPKVYSVREVEMTESQERYYAQMKSSMAVDLEEQVAGLSDPTRAAVSANIILTQLLRLSQITSGFLSVRSGGDKIETQINNKNPKIEAIVTDLEEELRDDPLSKKIIWAIERESIRARS